jgi:hypothetical protein
MHSVEMEVVPVVMYSLDPTWVGVFGCFGVLFQGIVCPTPFPEPGEC